VEIAGEVHLSELMTDAWDGPEQLERLALRITNQALR
jgi:hypothetical protein